MTSNSSYPPHLHLFTSVQTRTYLQHWEQTQAKEENQYLNLSAIKLLVKIKKKKKMRVATSKNQPSSTFNIQTKIPKNT